MARITWSDTADGTEYTGTYNDYAPSKKTKRSSFSSKPMEQIVKAGVLTGKIALFGSRSSPAFSDYNQLHRNNLHIFYADPVVPGYDSPPKLFQYDYSVIIDAFEYIPEMMRKANLIKEALVTLKNNNSYTIMMAMTTKMVKELAKRKKYEDTGNGFLITNHSKLNGLVIKGIEAEELITTAYFAGAQSVEIDKDVKTDMTCVRAYPNKKAVKEYSKLFEKAQVSDAPKAAPIRSELSDIIYTGSTYGSTSTSSGSS